MGVYGTESRKKKMSFLIADLLKSEKGKNLNLKFKMQKDALKISIFRKQDLKKRKILFLKLSFQSLTPSNLPLAPRSFP